MARMRAKDAGRIPHKSCAFPLIFYPLLENSKNTLVTQKLGGVFSISSLSVPI